uniref:Uncharacterized protein n=1 Tax=Anguilla anguilla TaxID=7936 RepID=A0A0E9Q6Z3_ANGAN
MQCSFKIIPQFHAYMLLSAWMLSVFNIRVHNENRMGKL